MQDLPEVAANGTASLSSQPKDLVDRVSFQGHDFFQPQPQLGASVYLLRMILHDWAKAEAVQILSRLVPALDSGSKIVIMDTVLPRPGEVPVTKERLLRVRDLTMMQAFNSRERSLDDWKELLRLVDERLEVEDVQQPYGSSMSLLTIKLNQ